MYELRKRPPHHLKTWPRSFLDIIKRAKDFDYRRDDRAFCVGDELSFQEWDPAAKQRKSPVGGVHIQGDYTGRTARATILYIEREFVPEGFCVLRFHLTDMELFK